MLQKSVLIVSSVKRSVLSLACFRGPSMMFLSCLTNSSSVLIISSITFCRTYREWDQEISYIPYRFKKETSVNCDQIIPSQDSKVCWTQCSFSVRWSSSSLHLAQGLGHSQQLPLIFSTDGEEGLKHWSVQMGEGNYRYIAVGRGESGRQSDGRLSGQSYEKVQELCV